ncbi:hypothetical protein CRUP_011291 [Coryphaenoides rupestris]|nr:hypothetical protein CRUP_011291 [Coryphaenoides rupestris]
MNICRHLDEHVTRAPPRHRACASAAGRDASHGGAAAAQSVKQEQEKEREEDCSLLPLVHDIIKSIDKDGPDIHQELSKLRTRIQEAREQVSTSMPGIDTGPAEQRQQLAALRDQLM